MEVDLKKPRTREERGKIIGYKEFREFEKKHRRHNLKRSDLIKIARKFNEKIAEETMNNIYGVVLPFGIGLIFINNAGNPGKKKAVDYAASKKAGVKVYHRNWETDNNYMRIVYLNRSIRTRVKHNRLYGFNPSLKFRREASKYFKKHWSRCLNLNYKDKARIDIII